MESLDFLMLVSMRLWQKISSFCCFDVVSDAFRFACLWMFRQAVYLVGMSLDCICDGSGVFGSGVSTRTLLSDIING